MPEGMSREGVFGDEISNLPVNGRNLQSLGYLSSGVNASMVAETVDVVASPPPAKAASQGTDARKIKRRRGGNTGGGDRKDGGGGAGGGGGVDYNRVYSAREVSPPSEEQRRREQQTKLHPSILALIERLNNQSAQPGADEAKFVRDGKAEVQVWLTDKSEEALTQLKQIGFEVVLDQKTSKLVIGRLPIEKLAALAELKFVRYVAPQISR